MRLSDSHRTKRSLLSFGVTSLLAVTAATAQVATGTTGIDASGNYRSEVQACMSGNTQQDRDTCLKEARNARADKARGVLENEKPSTQNAAARCEPLSGEERAACQARVLGYGEASGSVAGGGVLKEVETVVLPPGQSEVVIQPKTADPVLIVPAK